jgi:hypothetical protein
VKRFLASAALAAALGGVAISATGCNADWSSATSPAATVNGHTVATVQSLKAVMAVVKNDAGFLCLNVGPKPQITGVGTDTYSMTFADEMLTLLVKYGITTTEAQSLGLYLPTSAQFTAAAKQQVVDGDDAELASLQQDGVTSCTTASQIISGEGSDLRGTQLESQVAQDALDAHFAGISLHPSELASYEASHPALTTDSCVDVLEVSSAKNEAIVESKIKAGKSWDSLVAKYSKAQGLGTDGAAGCAFGIQWVDNLGSVIDPLTIGTPSAPAKLGADYVFLLVTARHPVTEAEFLENLATQEQTPYQSATGGELRSAAVVVDPAYGTWSVSTSSSGLTVSIKPPGSNAAADAPNPAAVGVTTTTAPATAQPGS